MVVGGRGKADLNWHTILVLEMAEKLTSCMMAISSLEIHWKNKYLMILACKD